MSITPCPVCDSATTSLLSSKDRKGSQLNTVLCNNCGHVFNDPIPTSAELASFYARDYRVDYKGTEQPRARQIARNFARAEQFWRRWGHLLKRGPRILDVGAGSGEFLYLAQGLGYDASGIEPNYVYAAYCRNALSLRVETARLDEIHSFGVTYDFIRLNHVLEHLPDPVRSLQKLRDMLSPEGLLYVEVPNVVTYARIRSQGRMFHYGHICNFSPWTLRVVAGRAGLVEHPDCQIEQADKTSTFFRKGQAIDARYAANDSNVASIRTAIASHYDNRPTILTTTSKVFRKIAARLRETVTVSKTRGSAQAIGIQCLDRLRPFTGLSMRENEKE